MAGSCGSGVGAEKPDDLAVAGCGGLYRSPYEQRPLPQPLAHPTHFHTRQLGGLGR